MTISKKKAMKGGALPSPASGLSTMNKIHFYLKASKDAPIDSPLRMSMGLKAINEVLQNDLDVANPSLRKTIKIKFNSFANYDLNLLKEKENKTLLKKNKTLLKHLKEYREEWYVNNKENKTLNKQLININKQLINIKKENKTFIKEVRSLTKKLFEEQKKTQKERTKKIIEKQETRTKNLACKNEIDFILQEKIEDIPTEDLVYIKLKTHIYCFDKDSFKGMITYSKNQKVKGACKQAIPGIPLDCKWFYPINLGFNVFINKENYTDALKNKNVTKWILKNKRRVNFTTGLHRMSEKSGMDDVYDLVPDKAKFSCSAWRKNPLIDPKTGFKIKKNGPLYKKYKAKCGAPLINS